MKERYILVGALILFTAMAALVFAEPDSSSLPARPFGPDAERARQLEVPVATPLPPVRPPVRRPPLRRPPRDVRDPDPFSGAITAEPALRLANAGAPPEAVARAAKDSAARAIEQARAEMDKVSAPPPARKRLHGKPRRRVLPAAAATP